MKAQNRTASGTDIPPIASKVDIKSSSTRRLKLCRKISVDGEYLTLKCDLHHGVHDNYRLSLTLLQPLTLQSNILVALILQMIEKYKLALTAFNVTSKRLFLKTDLSTLTTGRISALLSFVHMTDSLLNTCRDIVSCHTSLTDERRIMTATSVCCCKMRHQHLRKAGKHRNIYSTCI